MELPQRYSDTHDANHASDLSVSSALFVRRRAFKVGAPVTGTCAPL